MKRALGFRAEAQKIHWAVVEGTRNEPILVAVDDAAAPVGLEEAPSLSWYANRVQLVVETYKPSAAGVRFAESIARGGNKEGARRRLRIEGVLLQAIDASGLKVTTGPLATISAKLKTKNAKEYIDAGQLRGIDLTKIPLPSREAVAVAVAALPENGE